MSDLALCADLAGEVRLFDIDVRAAEANVAVGNALFSHPDARTSFRVRAVRSAQEALEGSDFVVLSIEPGSITMRYADLEIPRRYGILQPVGDTTGPGGILRALRAVPIYEDYAHQIMTACPRAWVINYTNPMTICTASLYAAEPGIKAFGCCHEVFGTQERLADWVGRWFKTEPPDRRFLRLDITGVNHFTFATAASWDGHDLFPRIRDMIADPAFFADRSETAARRRAEEKWFENDGLIACDFFARFGVLGAAGDRHLAEFVPWYLTSEENLHRWGVTRTPYEWRVARLSRLSRREPGAPLTPSGEEGVQQMRALLGDDSLVANVNLPNRGQAPDLPPGAVVETYARFERDEIRPLLSRPLPPLLASIVSHVAKVQQTTLEAARLGDREMAFQALIADPLVRISTDDARRMFAEMLDHAREALPRFR
jgi:alpha-galactosidase